MRLKQCLGAVICGLVLLQPLAAQSTVNETCGGSTVDIQGAETAKQARAFLKELKAAVQADDRGRIADMISYPLNVIRVDKRTRIPNKATLLSRYDNIFTPHIKEAILHQSARCLFGNANGEMIGTGEVWFSEMGNGEVKIYTVNPSAGK
jgi:hypothetical protein